MTEEKNQEIIKIIKPSPLSYLFDYLAGVVIIIFSLFFVWYYLFLGLLGIIIFELIRRSHTYYITSQEVREKFSFVSTKIVSASYDKIQDVTIVQSFFERLLNVGTIKINTAGSPTVEITFQGIKNPQAVKEIIQQKIS